MILENAWQSMPNYRTTALLQLDEDGEDELLRW